MKSRCFRLLPIAVLSLGTMTLFAQDVDQAAKDTAKVRRKRRRKRPRTPTTPTKGWRHD